MAPRGEFLGLPPNPYLCFPSEICDLIKQKLCPKTKQPDQRHLGAFAMKTFFYSPPNLRKFCTKGASYCAPSEVGATKRSNKTNATCLHLQLRPFLVFIPKHFKLGHVWRHGGEFWAFSPKFAVFQ